MYNKNNLGVAKVASKSTIRPELSCVAFCGDRTIATDSFRLIQMSANGKKKNVPILYRADEIKKLKLKKDETIDESAIPIKMATIGSAEYPNTDTIFDSLKNKKYVGVRVNAAYLADICNVLKDLDPFQAIVLKVPVDEKYAPIIITAETQKKNGEAEQTARALLAVMNP